MTEGTGLIDHHGAIDALDSALQRLVDVAERVPPHTPIPTCPEWDAAQLWEHLGSVHRWVTAHLRERSIEPISRRSIRIDAPTDDRWSPWLAQGGSDLVSSLRSIGASAPVWTWSGDNTAGWWSRRQLHETVVHTADGALAIGEDFSVDPVVAADGIAELLDNAIVRLGLGATTPPPTDATVHIHATDGPSPTGVELGDHGEFMVELRDGALAWTHGHGKGDLALRGSASELMLVLNRRRRPDDADVEVFGEIGLLADLTAAAHA